MKIILAFFIGLIFTYDNIFYGEMMQDNIKRNFLSIVRDGNQPTFCQTSWAFAITSAMAT